jgi:hypothetical protein
MLLAFYDGSLQLDQIHSRAREFVRAANRMFLTMFAPRSLDMPAYRDGKTPLIETIATGLWS